MGKREMLRWVVIGVVAAIVATYAVRGIDWLGAQLPALLLALAPLIESISSWLWNPLRQLLPVAGILMVLLWATAIRQHSGSGIQGVSRRVIEWAARRLPQGWQRNRWRDEWLGDLDVIGTDRPISGLLYSIAVARASGRVATVL